MEAKGLIESYELRARPVPRNRLAKLVEHVYTKASENPEILSKTDWRLLDQLMGDFYDELHTRNAFPDQLKKEKHLFKEQILIRRRKK